MAVNQADLEYLEEIINYCFDHPKLSPWEKKFMTDMKQRFDQYKERIMVSEKQWAVLERIYDACQTV